MHTTHQSALFEQMESPAFYPHPADSVKTLETHISKVFLAGDYVYKIKKPLDLGFLDFTTLENRKYFCRQEVVLNRRLTRNIYLDAVGITCKNGQYRLGGKDVPVEYAVKMRRLPDSCSMKYLMREGRIHESQIKKLARLLSEFYDQNSDIRPRDMKITFETIRANCAENFMQADPYAGKYFDRDVFDTVRSKTVSFLNRRKTIFEDRMQQNCFRDCHGDLRTGHVYFTEDGFTDAGIQIIDCIEFNERFRYQDVASDLAFLVMDMEFLGYPELAENLLFSYARFSNDSGVYLLIDFYKCYRALVRLKVKCIGLQGNNPAKRERDKLVAKIRRYLALGHHYILCAARPVLWVVCGMPATGKSTIAGELGHALKVRVINSDVVRKKMFGSPSRTPLQIPFESGIYSKTATVRTYSWMLRLARKEIENGNSVVLDATFAARHFRREAIRLAEETDAGILFAECVVPENLLKQRLKERENKETVSDARISHYSFFKKRFEPLDEIEADSHIIVHAEQLADACVGRMLAAKYKNSQRDLYRIS